MATVIRDPLVRPKAIAWLAVAALAFGLISTVQAAAGLAYTHHSIRWTGLLKANLVNAFLYAAFVPLLYRLALLRPIQRETWPAALPFHLLAGVILAVVKAALFTLIGNWFRPGVFHLAEMLAGNYFDEILFFWAMISGVHVYLGWTVMWPEQTEDDCAQPIDRFFVSGAGGYRVVMRDEVEWIAAQGNYAQLHTRQSSHLVRETMASLERRLGDDFIRVHRGAMVNRLHIQRIESRSHGSYAITVASGTPIVSSRSYNARLRTLVG